MLSIELYSNNDLDTVTRYAHESRNPALKFLRKTPLIYLCPSVKSVSNEENNLDTIHVQHTRHGEADRRSRTKLL